MERRAGLEDAQIRVCPLLDILANRVEPRGGACVLNTPVSRLRLGLGLERSAERRLERGLGEAQFIPDCAAPDCSATPRCNAAPPHVPGSALADGIVPAGEDVLLPDRHYAVGGDIAALGAGALGGLATAFGFEALGHHLLILLEVAAFLGGVLGREP